MKQNPVKRFFGFVAAALTFRHVFQRPNILLRNDPSVDEPHKHHRFRCGNRLTRHEHRVRDEQDGRRIYGLYIRTPGGWLKRAPNPVCSRLVVPELRKRRSKQDPDVLRQQQINYRPVI